MKIEKRLKGGILVSVKTAGDLCPDAMSTYIKVPFEDIVSWYPAIAGHYMVYNEDLNKVQVQFSHLCLLKKRTANLLAMYGDAVSSFDIDEEGTLIIPEGKLTIFDVLGKYNERSLAITLTRNPDEMDTKEDIRSEVKKVLSKIDSPTLSCDVSNYGEVYTLLQARARIIK